MNRIQIAWPWSLGPNLPKLPAGYVFLVDDYGTYILDDAGNYFIVESAYG